LGALDGEGSSKTLRVAQVWILIGIIDRLLWRVTAAGS
jgi:hypothetical protein